jgi:hypothetical protein
MGNVIMAVGHVDSLVIHMVMGDVRHGRAYRTGSWNKSTVTSLSSSKSRDLCIEID